MAEFQESKPQCSRTSQVRLSHVFCVHLAKSVSSVQSLSHVQLFSTPWTAAHQASLSITNSRSLLKLKSIESVMPSNHLILCRPLFLPPSIFPSIRVFLFGQSKQGKQAQSQCVKSLDQGMGTMTPSAERYIEGLLAVQPNGLKELALTKHSRAHAQKGKWG